MHGISVSLSSPAPLKLMVSVAETAVVSAEPHCDNSEAEKMKSYQSGSSDSEEGVLKYSKYQAHAWTFLPTEIRAKPLNKLHMIPKVIQHKTLLTICSFAKQSCRERLNCKKAKCASEVMICNGCQKKAQKSHTCRAAACQTRGEWKKHICENSARSRASNLSGLRGSC